MKNLVLYAPPAAGKGTECENLIQEYGYEVLSIGQVLRDARNPETEVGRKIIEAQDAGVLVSDDIVAEALKGELDKLKGKSIIIEGYPRNIAQAKLLDTIFTDYIVINLFIDREVARKRMVGRITCSNCNKIYNKYSEDLCPKIEGICDVCGAKLEDRSDDNEKSFKVRFDVYEENAPQILEFYENKNILYKVNSGISKEYTHTEVKKILEGIND